MDRQSTTLLLLALMVLGGTAITRYSSDGAGDKSPEGAAKRDQAESGYGSPETAAVDLIGRFFESVDPTDNEPRAIAEYSASVGNTTAKLSIKTSADSDQGDLARVLP